MRLRSPGHRLTTRRHPVELDAPTYGAAEVRFCNRRDCRRDSSAGPVELRESPGRAAGREAFVGGGGGSESREDSSSGDGRRAAAKASGGGGGGSEPRDGRIDTELLALSSDGSGSAGVNVAVSTRPAWRWQCSTLTLSYMCGLAWHSPGAALPSLPLSLALSMREAARDKHDQRRGGGMEPTSSDKGCTWVIFYSNKAVASAFRCETDHIDRRLDKRAPVYL